MTQHDLLIAALEYHGCKRVESNTRWEKWTLGNSTNSWFHPDRWFFVGTTGFRCGRNRTQSVDWPKTRAGLIAEAKAHLRDGKLMWPIDEENMRV
jgi:hypothetical protein